MFPKLLVCHLFDELLSTLYCFFQMTVTATDQGTPVKNKTVQVTVVVYRNLNAPTFTNLPSVTAINEDLQKNLDVYTVSAEDLDTRVSLCTQLLYFFCNPHFQQPCL